MASKTGSEAVTRNLPVSKVTVHPLVLLNVVDHFNRISKTGHVRRVVGVLLGSWCGKDVDISNSFAVPFDEDEKDKNVWFLDHDYLENMYHMFRKVNSREKVVGWYHTGPTLHHNDIEVNEMMKRFTANPILVIVDAKPKPLGLPTEAYIEVEEVHDDGTPATKTFEHVVSDIGAEEAEEVGVEHLLRDIKDMTAGTLSQHITHKVTGLKGLENLLKDVQRYLSQVAAGTMPTNHALIYLLQDVMNLLPNCASPDFLRAMNIQTNDQLLAVYLGSLARSVVALHNLIANKLSLRELERKDTDKPERKEKESEKVAGERKDTEKAKPANTTGSG